MRKLFVLAPVAACLLLVGQAALSQPSSASETVDYLDDTPRPDDSLYVMPARDSGASMPFWKVEVKPQPISIPQAEYPEKARKAGIEGQTVVYALIDTNGSVADVRVLKASGNADLDRAAAAAAREAKFRPARQHDKPVRVWVSLPFRFRLDDGKKTDPTVPKGLVVRDDEMWPRTTPEPYRAASLDSALADLARKLTDSTHGESLPRLAVTPFEELNGSVGDTGVYIAEVLEMQLAASGRCRVVEREAIAQLLGVSAPTRAALMDTAARRNLVRVFRLSGIVAGTVAHMDGGMKVMARVVNPRTGLITRTGEVWVRPEARPQNPPPRPPPRFPPTYPPPAPGVIRFEGESMKVLQVTAGTASRQDLGRSGWSESWSGGAHLWWRNAKVGDRLELGFDVPTNGTYRLKLRLTKAYDYGIEQCYLDGHKLSEPMDLYNGLSTEGNSHAVTATDPLDMGSHMLRQGQHKLEFRVVGINPKAVQSYMFGIDYLDLAGPESPGGKRAGRSAFPDTVVATINVGGRPHGIVSLSSRPYAYVCNQVNHGVCVVNTDELRVVKTVACGDDAWQIIASPDDQCLYVANRDANTVKVISAKSDSVVATVQVGDRPFSMVCTPNGDRVYVASFNDNRVSVIRTSDYTVVATIPVGQGPRGLCILPSGKYVYTANTAGSSTVIRTSDNTVVKTVTAPGFAHRAAASGDGRFVYLSNQHSNSVSVIRTSDNTHVGTVPVSAGPFGGLGPRSSDYVYIACPGSNSLAVIRASDNTAAGAVQVGEDCWEVSASASGDRLYTANHVSGSVSVIARR